MIALFALACAATWLSGEPLPPDGVVLLDGGDALRLRVEPAGALLQVVDPLGAEVPLYGAPEGLLVPADPLSRTLVVQPEAGARVWVYREDNRAVLRAWERWESAAWRAQRTGLPIPPPPTGGLRLAAELNLREEVVESLSVRALGLLADVVPYAPISSVSHRVPGARKAPEKPEIAQSTARTNGPGVALIHTWPEAGGALVRYEVSPVLDGRTLRTHALASTGAAARTVRVWVPPGVHELEVRTTLPAGVVDLELAPMRPAVGQPRMARCDNYAGLPAADAAELAWICEDVDRALDGYRALRDSPDPATAALALARLLALEEDPARRAEDLALALSRLPESSPNAREVLANALLTQADELSDEAVLTALRAARDPNPAALSAWLDAHGGLRPAGIALLELARPLIPNQDLLGRALLVQAGLDTRLTLLEAEGAPPGALLRSSRGPGVARVLLRAGERAELTLEDSFPGRLPVLRLRAEAPVRFTLDGASLRSPGGVLDFALPPGPHSLSVEEGELILPDPEGVVGGSMVYERVAVPLPATWALPDPGVPVELRLELLDAPGECAVLASFDTGEVRCAAREMQAPAAATSLTLEGPGWATVGMRALIGGERPAPLLPVQDLDAALEALEALSRRVHAGDAAARLERAELLARLGSLELARHDLAVAAEDPALARAAAALAPRLPPLRPSAPMAPTPAPRAPEGALALAGDPGPITPEHLAGLGTPEALAQAARLWELEDPLRAIAAALDAGPAGAEALGRLEARLAWTPLSRVEAGGGLVELQVPLPESEAPWARVREALLALPAPGDDWLVARGGLGVLSRFHGSRLDLQLQCRDEQLLAKPCNFTLRVDATRQTYTLADGRSLTLRFDLAPGGHEIELTPADRTVAVRAEVDGVLLPPTVPRLAVRVSPESPARLSVSAPAVVRVDVLRGALSAEAGGRTARVAAGERALLPLAGDGAVPLSLSGDAEVLLWWGTFEPPPVPPVYALPEPLPPPGPDPAVRDEVLSRFAHPITDPGILPTAPFSVQLGLVPQLSRIGTSAELWRTEQLFAELLHAESRDWQRAALWYNGPDWAGQSPTQHALGLELEAGKIRKEAWAGLRLSAAGATRSFYSAGSLRLSAFAVRDLDLGPTFELRGAARARASLASPAPGPVRVDPLAWNERIANDPLEGALSASLLARPARDLRTELGVQLDLRGPGGWQGQWGAFAEGNLMIGDMGCLTLEALLNGAVAADLGALPPAGPQLGLGYDHVLWSGPTRRWVVFGEASYWPSPGVAEGQVGVRLLLTPYRGVDDLPPYRELFLTHRGGP